MQWHLLLYSQFSSMLIGSLLLKMLKYFEVTLNIFEFPHAKKIIESLLVYTNHTIMFLTLSCFLCHQRYSWRHHIDYVTYDEIFVKVERCVVPSFK